jgi:hypothetical protein
MSSDIIYLIGGIGGLYSTDLRCSLQDIQAINKLAKVGNKRCCPCRRPKWLKAECTVQNLQIWQSRVLYALRPHIPLGAATYLQFEESRKYGGQKLEKLRINEKD